MSSGAKRDSGRHSQSRHGRFGFRSRTTVDEIRERMSGNICRCGAYANILAAIEDAAGEIKS
ncbi:2Fe-2S iron-sulfur cluster-binding protein [Escherichia coli]